MRTLAGDTANFEPLKHIWNRYYRVNNPISGRPDRRNIVRREIMQRLFCNPIGNGNKWRRRYETMCKGQFHLIGNIYLT